MIKNRFTGVFGAVVLLAALAAPANGAEINTDPGTQREFAARMKVCEACHGQDGVPKSANIPIISGQQGDYLAKQLHDFRAGNRKIEVMSWMAEALSDAEVGPTAANFTKKSWPARAAAAAAPAAAPRGIAVCQSCHQQNFLGAVQAEGMTTPRLAGQRYEYLVEAMRRFAEGERTNNADMVQIMKAISPADRDAMARYLSSL
jgi:cytochrome c553